jgi:hypothetical protein
MNSFNQVRAKAEANTATGGPDLVDETLEESFPVSDPLARKIGKN